MKKNRLCLPFAGRLKKLLLTMKLTTILSFSLIVSINASVLDSYSQNSNLSLKMMDATIKEVMDKIEKSSDFIFVYYDNIIDVNRKVSIDVEKQSIENILDEMFTSTNNSYIVIDRQIVISLKDQPEIQKDLPLANEDDPQQILIKGVVTDHEGNPLPGVTIVLKGTTIGTLSDVSGKFFLSVPGRDALLSFSYIGFTTQELPATSGTDMNVIMSMEITQISEVVVVGYGVQKKESVVGAITQVNNATLMRGGNVNVSNAMAGKLSGVLAIQATGEPGKDQSEIIVRGLSSWNSSAPLVLVDGVERDFNNMDPNEINTISVLKDASATAVFGAKGANGVIVVTTKRGALGKPKLNFTASYGMQRATKTYAFIDSYTTMNMLNVTNMNDQRFEGVIPANILEEYRNPSTPLNALRYPNVDWYDELTKPFASTANANITVQGGTNFIKYFSSIGYSYQGDYFKGFHNGYQDTRYMYSRFNYRSNLDFNLTQSTLLSLTIGGDIDIKNTPGAYPWKDMFQNSGARYPMNFPAWVLEEVPDPDYPEASGMRLSDPLGEMGQNPYNDLYQGSFNKNLGATLFTDLILDQKLSFLLKGLSLKGKVSLSTYYNSSLLTCSYSFPQYQLNFDKIGIPGVNPWYRKGESNETYETPLLNLGAGGLNNGYYTDLYYEMSLNYSNSFGKHNVSGLALFNRQQKNRQTSANGNEFPYYNEALVGRATYDFNHKYLVEVNIGYTGSERFAPGNRFGFFPSAAVGWVISEEQFFKNAATWMNKLKLRYSDGLVGSDNANNRWLYVNDYWVDDGGYIHESAIANTTSQWEQSRKRDLGVEIGLFKNLLTINVDLFDDYRSKMLLAPRSVTFLVASTFKELNIGEMEKHGIETEVEFNKTTGSGVNYYIKGIIGFNENRVIFKDDPVYSPDYTKDAGKPLYAQLKGVTLTGSGYYTSVDDIHKNPSAAGPDNLVIGDYKFLDFNSDGKVSNLDEFPIKGTTYPPISYSLSSGVTYKGFSFNFMFQGDWGKYVEFNQAFEMEFYYGAWRVHKSQLDYWRPDNQDGTHATLHYSTATPIAYNWGGGGTGDDGYFYFLQDHFWRNASYLRLKELYFGYTFNTANLKQTIGFSNLLVFIQANNLWTLTPLIEGDPERKEFLYGPGDRSIYPQMITLKLGVKLGF